MPDTLFVTPGPIKWASSRLRAHWAAEYMGADVIEYEEGEYHEGYNTVIFVKVTDAELVNQYKKDGKRVWWDICDPVHWFNPIGCKKVFDLVDGIVFSNLGLCNDFGEWYGEYDKPGVVIPDRLKLDHYKPRKTISTDLPVRFIWFGAFQNRYGLMAGFSYLERLRANGVELSLTICDDMPNEVWKYAAFPIYHIDWDLAHESNIISGHDIAILPSHPPPWGNVKSNNKHLTAYACGVPPVTGEDWNDIWKMTTDPEYRKTMAERGLKWVQENYDVKQSAEEWKALLCE